jgi:hypothetical protein
VSIFNWRSASRENSIAYFIRDIRRTGTVGAQIQRVYFFLASSAAWAAANRAIGTRNGEQLT